MYHLFSKNIRLYKLLLLCFFIYIFFLRIHNLSSRTFELWDEGWYFSSAGSALVFIDYLRKTNYNFLCDSFEIGKLRETVRANAPVPFGGDSKPVFSVVLLIGLLIGGFDQFSIFFEMIIISLITMYFVYLIGSYIFSIEIGTMSALFFGMSGIMTYFSRSCMPQMVMVLFCMISFYASLRITERRIMLVIFPISSVLAFFTHPATGPLLIIFWLYAIGSILRKKINLKTNLSIIFINFLVSAILFIFIAELPKLAFSDHLGHGEYVGYFENINLRSNASNSTYFKTIYELQFLLSNLWESEFLIILFSIIGAIILIIRYPTKYEIILLIAPITFILIYFFLGISYRFRIFIVIYPFIHIIGGLGFVKSYKFLSSFFYKYKIYIKILYTTFLVIIIFQGLNLSISFENSNKEVFSRICAGIDDYLSRLPRSEKREISFYQGDISTWFYYYFTEKRLYQLYPSLLNSMIWDWRKHRPFLPDYGDFIIAVEDSENGCRSYRMSKNEFSKIIDGKKQIMSIPFEHISRCDDYTKTTFNKKMVLLKVYDLKS
ncbi:hypothetical protein C4565_05635 [Candidatus Parcubacteria bacterium]|nr:MAG: hypothetical protein C4565_05635 [Candidatus Parcubacteria bacterium]